MKPKLSLAGVVLILLIASCGSPKKIVYFQDSQNFETIVADNAFEPKFKVDDVVSIYVATLNPEASAPFNLTIGVAANGQSESLDYLVDKNGEIDFPVIGKVKILGLSPEEVKSLLRKELSSYLKDPIINVRLRNFTVTILGEVRNPGTYPIIGEQITILEALGLAGDLTIKGKRENIMVIRDFDGVKVYNKIDLTSKEAMKSPAFYLTQNDVVYVEPNKSAVSASSLDNRTTIFISLLSLAITSTLILVR
ncbi:polysaccharide export outer membrane protein [Flagellimonas taeanensis]|uniref:Polysaccharide export outer membrane protein n=1 Tax=Flagellimonas taeanensis TaxID=1005926 RepID=A0A1M6V3I2_9FLAO|nr:polysaccharide biosynthesis/export family protein [Allomuricauda taeanensis]SFC20897.1 polysaccharide export outer membrane protein [Allomuricauda taeanensis]SHK76069.1 polysaccharide export outer membrane protein [Allomuricauda taeanensis]